MSLFFGMRPHLRRSTVAGHPVISRQNIGLERGLKPIFHCNAKLLALGPTLKFALAIPTCWYLKRLKFALPPTRNIEFAFARTQTTNANQWNIGFVGYPMQNFRIGYVYFIFLVSISFAFGGQRKPSFQWNMGLTL